MGIEFNADEIFEIAEQIERNGAGFYRRAAEAVEDSQKRRILLDLASREDEHEKTFAAMRLTDAVSFTRDTGIFTRKMDLPFKRSTTPIISCQE